MPVHRARTDVFDALEQFNALVNQQGAGWGVNAASNKSALKIGKDSLGFTITSAKAGYVNVLVLGPDGRLVAGPVGGAVRAAPARGLKPIRF